jgi:hypothetical protein
VKFAKKLIVHHEIARSEELAIAVNAVETVASHANTASHIAAAEQSLQIANS